MEENVYPAGLCNTSIVARTGGRTDDKVRAASRRQDRIAGTLFVINFIISSALAIIFMIFGFWKFELAMKYTIKYILRITAIETLSGFIVTVVLSILDLYLLRNFSLLMMHLPLAICATLFIILGIIVDFTMDFLIPLILGGITVIFGYSYYLTRQNLRISALSLKLLVSVERRVLNLYLLVVGGVLFSYYYTLFHVLATIPMMDMLEGMGFDWVRRLLGLYQVCSILLTIYVLLLLVQLVVATVFEQHYLPADHPMASLSIPRIIWLGMRYKVGSLCYGLFFVGPITSAYWIAQTFFGIRSDSSSFLRRQIRNCNYYAFNGLIIRNQTFREASMDAWDKMVENGVDKLVEQNFISSTMTYSSLAICVIAGFVSAIAMRIMGPHHRLIHLSSYFVTTAALAFPITGFIFKIVDSGRNAIMPIIAHNPELIRKDFFELYSFLNTSRDSYLE